MTREAPAGIGASVARGAIWIAGGSILMRLIGLANTLILARILAPDDFGVVALGVAVMQLLQNVSDIGVAQAVVRFRDAGRREIDTLFSLSAIRGLLIAGVLAAAAPFAAAFYDDQRVSIIFVSMGMIALLQSLINPKFYEFQRGLDFRQETLAGGLNKIVAVIASVAVAYVTRSFWAIIAGLAAGAAAQVAISYAMRPYLPRFQLSALREIAPFAGWLTGVSFMAALNNKLDILLIGRFVGAANAGAYYLGGQLASLPTNEVSYPIARALFPGLSALQGDVARMREAFLKGAEALAATAMPAAIGCAFIAPEFVQLLLGSQWDAAAPIVRVFAPVVALIAIYYPTQALAVAMGATRKVFFRELWFFLIKAPVFVWATMTYGLDGAIWASAGLGLLYVAFNARLYAQVAGGSPIEPLQRSWRSFASLGSMAMWFLWLRPIFPGGENLPLFPRVIVDVAVAAIVFYGAHFAIWASRGRPDGVERMALRLLQR